jgi:hypothetical protein
LIAEERIKLLEAERFIWESFERLERLQELKDYKQNFGDTLVPQGCAANPSLGTWVDNHRRCYEHFQKMKELEGKWRGVDVLDDEVKKEIKRLNRMAEGMSDRRIQLLEAEGFIWDSFEAQWLEMLDELRAYKEINGDTLVPAIYPANPSLGQWVSNQRKC